MNLRRGQALDLSEVLVVFSVLADESLLDWLTEVVEGDGKAKKKTQSWNQIDLSNGAVLCRGRRLDEGLLAASENALLRVHPQSSLDLVV